MDCAIDYDYAIDCCKALDSVFDCCEKNAIDYAIDYALGSQNVNFSLAAFCIKIFYFMHIKMPPKRKSRKQSRSRSRSRSPVRSPVMSRSRSRSRSRSGTRTVYLRKVPKYLTRSCSNFIADRRAGQGVVLNPVTGRLIKLTHPVAKTLAKRCATCDDFRFNPKKNPLTGRRISMDSSNYRNLSTKCGY